MPGIMYVAKPGRVHWGSCRFNEELQMDEKRKAEVPRQDRYGSAKGFFFGICLTNLSWNPNRPHPIHVHPYTLEKSRKLVQHHVIDTLWHVKLWVFFTLLKWGFTILRMWAEQLYYVYTTTYSYTQLHTITGNETQWHTIRSITYIYIQLHEIFYN